MNNNPTVYDDGTVAEVKQILSDYLHNGKRLRLFYGDKDTGADWGEENDVIGYIGKSTGTMPCALLIKNSRSMGGGAILTARIVKIIDVTTKRVLYFHPLYHARYEAQQYSDLPDYGAEVYKSGELWARCKTMEQAERLAGFMRGDRMSK